MPLGEAIRLRIEQDLLDKFQHEATMRDISLQEVIREKLAFLDGLNETLTDIRREISGDFVGLQQQIEAMANIGAGSSGGSQGLPANAQYEMLLLMRQLAGAGALRSVHSELKRQKMSVYNPDKEQE